MEEKQFGGICKNTLEKRKTCPCKTCSRLRALRKRTDQAIKRARRNREMND